MKRFYFSLVINGCLLVSSNVLAAYPAAADSAEVSLPQLPYPYDLGSTEVSVYQTKNLFFVGLTGFYLQPSISNGVIDYASVNYGATPNFNSNLKTVKPHYDINWGVNAGFTFQNGADVNLSYLRYETEQKDSVTADSGSNISPINFNTNFQGVGARSRAQFDLTQADLTAGQNINVGRRLIVHPNAGVRYSHLIRTLDSHYQDKLSPAHDAITIHQHDDFDGVGPLVGIDANYYIDHGVGIVGHFDSALLIGNIDPSLHGTDNSTQQIFEYQAQSSRRIVPELDGKLGADYTYLIDSDSNAALTLELGYQVNHYFNAIDSLIVSESQQTILGRRTADFALNGPYVTLTYRI